MTNTSKRDGWHRVPGLTDVHNKGKTYRGMVRFERPCATCSEPFGIFVTPAVADGVASNSSFGLKNCEQHRMRMTPAGNGNTDKLEMMVRTMREELDGLYKRNAALLRDAEILRAENKVLKGKFATYELQPAMDRLAKQPADATGQHLAKLFAKKIDGAAAANDLTKMPWQP